MRAQTSLVWAPIIILQDAAARAQPSARAAFPGRAQPFIAYLSSNAVELQCSSWGRETNLEICGIRDFRA